MNSTDISDYLEALPSRAIALTPNQIAQAMQRSSLIADSTQQWQTYLNTLSLLGFEQWLNQRARDMTTHRSHDLVSQSSATLPAVSHLIVNGFQVCAIAVESQPDEVEISRDAIAAPEFAAHFYVAVAVYEEHAQIAVHSFLRYDQLTAQIQSLHPDTDNLYSIPIHNFELDLDRLLLYLRCSQPAAIPLPNTQQTPATPHSALSISPTETLREQHSALINVHRWFRNELDELARQLAWILLPPTALDSAMRLTAKVINQSSPQESFEGVVKQLVRNGMVLPPNARVAYQDLTIGTVAARLHAIAGTLPINEHPPEWTLLIILGPRSQIPLPHGTQLQIRESATVLVQQTLNPPNTYLYAKVIGALDEQFSVTITIPDGETITLPAFSY